MSATRRYGWEELTFGSDDQGSRERLRELILYVADRCQGVPMFGATELLGILFRADFDSFARYGEPITGAPYKKLRQGPVPTAVKAVRSRMEEEGDILVVKEGYNPFLRDRVIPLREANLGKFKARDIAVIDEVIQLFHAASDTSEFLHVRAWKAAEYREEIPYEAAILSDEGLTERDIERAHELIAEHGWDV